MLTLSGGQAETLFDLALPVEVGELPADLAALDRLLADPALLAPIAAAWEVSALGFGPPRGGTGPNSTSVTASGVANEPVNLALCSASNVQP